MVVDIVLLRMLVFFELFFYSTVSQQVHEEHDGTNS